jgi:hypothetical protein
MAEQRVRDDEAARMKERQEMEKRTRDEEAARMTEQREIDAWPRRKGHVTRRLLR